MEKWKVVAIVFLLSALFGYGAMQSRQDKQGPDVGQPTATPTPSPLLNKPIPTWSIPKNYWVNSTEPITPDDLKGSVAIVEFFRIECPHCQDAAPFMEKLYQTYKSKGLKIVAIQAPGQSEVEKKWENVKNFVTQHNITYPVGFDEGGVNFKTKFNGTNYPTVMVLDKQGVVRYFHTGFTLASGVELESVVKQQLGK